MLKDLGLAMEAAGTAGIDAEMGKRAFELYSAWVAAGNGDVDFSGIIQSL